MGRLAWLRGYGHFVRFQESVEVELTSLSCEKENNSPENIGVGPQQWWLG